MRAPDDRREDACAWTLGVARRFRERYELAQKGAPRLADMKKQTGAMEKHARKLVHLLDESDPYFGWVATGYLGMDEWKDDQGVPHIPKMLTDPQERIQLTAMLQELASLARQLREALPKDTGGDPDLRGIFETPPAWLLAVDCWELFDWFRPGKATGHVDGDYHAYVEIVYELAIEEKPNSGLTVYTKRAAPRCKVYAEGKPAYRHLRHARFPGKSPIDLITESGLAADFYNVPARLLDEIMGRKRRR